MATSQQVKQSLELALSLVSTLDTHRNSVEYLNELSNLTEQVATILSTALALKTKSPETKTEVHPIDTLLKKGKVELPEGRYKQLIQIHDQLVIFKIKFLSAKQNQNVTWFPLEWNGDKSAALYLSSSEWSIAPIKYRDDNDLTGEWEGFDLTEFMSMNCPDFDQDEY
jgi:hypothetical protein